MRLANKLASVVLGGLMMAISAAPATAKPETFKLDPAHSCVYFRIKHFDVSYVYGRFNDPQGTFVLDTENLENSAFMVEVKTENVDIANKNRDNHLKSPDFFNARQFPVISFKSTSVKPMPEDKFEVKGKLNLHGVEKEITVVLEQTGRAEVQGKTHVGFEGKMAIKRSDFAMDKMVGPVGDDVTLLISLDGGQQSNMAQNPAKSPAPTAKEPQKSAKPKPATKS